MLVSYSDLKSLQIPSIYILRRNLLAILDFRNAPMKEAGKASKNCLNCAFSRIKCTLLRGDGIVILNLCHKSFFRSFFLQLLPLFRFGNLQLHPNNHVLKSKN